MISCITNKAIGLLVNDKASKPLHIVKTNKQTKQSKKDIKLTYTEEFVTK